VTADPRRLVVVGASLAGLRAVEAARKIGFDGAIDLVGAEEHLPYDRPPLSKAHLETGTAPDVVFRTREQLIELDVDLHLGLRATALDPQTREVVLGESDSGSAMTHSSSQRAPQPARCPAARTCRACTCCAPSTTPSPCGQRWMRDPATSLSSALGSSAPRSRREPARTVSR
jgi:hypothetical protein